MFVILKDGTHFESGAPMACAQVFILGAAAEIDRIAEGASVDEVVELLARLRFDPNVVTNDREVPRATSVLDYVASKLRLKYVRETAAAAGGGA